MKKYKISEVAGMFDISRTALIHYDKWGILSPSIRNEKNYRFYTNEDIKKLELIVALKESGLALGEIKSYLHESINKTSAQLLIQQMDKIDKKIHSLQVQRSVIDKRIEHLSKFDNIELYDDVVLKENPEIAIAFEPIGFGPLMNYSSAVNKLKSKLVNDSQLTSKYGVCFDIAHPDQSRSYTEKYVFDYLTDHPKTANTMIIPESKSLQVIHEGPHSSIGNSISRILEYAEKHHYQPKGEAYYVPLFDYWESMSSEFVGEILVPIV